MTMPESDTEGEGGVEEAPLAPDAAPEPVPEPEPEPEPRADPALLAPDASGIDFRMALVASISLDLPSQHPSVVLREIDTPRRQLTFSIGMPDAVALSHAQRRIPTPRPLSHELLSDVLQSFDIDVVDLRGRTGRSVLSCRPSDALTVALRQHVPVPILIDARLLAGPEDVAPPGAKI